MSAEVHSFTDQAHATMAGELVAQVALARVCHHATDPDAMFRALQEVITVEGLEVFAAKGFCRAIQKLIERGVQ